MSEQNLDTDRRMVQGCLSKDRVSNNAVFRIAKASRKRLALFEAKDFSQAEQPLVPGYAVWSWLGTSYLITQAITTWHRFVGI